MLYTSNAISVSKMLLRNFSLYEPIYEKYNNVPLTSVEVCKVVLGDTDDTTIYRDTKSHDTSIAEVTILSRY